MPRLDPRRILYQDEHFLAVHKLAGELSVRGKGPVGKLPLFDFLRREFPGIHPLNRLDFDTSGIVLFARTRVVLKRMIEDPPAMTKTYRTLVAGSIAREEGDIRTPLPARTGGGQVPAHTHYRVLRRFAACSEVETVITSGRHHQIRRHFQKIGHPLVNDLLYGDKKFNRKFIMAHRYRKFFLHAATVEFTNPFTGKEIRIEDPLPRAFEEALSLLRGGS